MNDNLIIFLLEVNLTLVVLFTAYKIFFERDRNFRVRRTYLLGSMGLSLLIPLIPEMVMSPVNQWTASAFQLEEVTIIPSGEVTGTGPAFSIQSILVLIYVVIFGLGLAKLVFQLVSILMAALKSEKFHWNGVEIHASKSLHASSFFGYIFMDPRYLKSVDTEHILQHEQIHQQQYHSLDRILAEVFVMLNWFNPVAWMIRSSVIENLEYLADSAVIRRGTDPFHYQLSILNQYIGSASITNTFSSQIKNRIIMLNKNYRTGSRWKIAMLLPMALLAMIIVSCTEVDTPEETGQKKAAESEEIIYTEVDEMPTFNGEGPMEFRKFIARNVKYPKEAAENGVSGKVFVSFIVGSDGRIEIPDPSEMPPDLEGKEMGVVVVSYRPHDNGGKEPNEEYVELLKKEAVRVISSSPAWEPGKVNGTPVSVMFTFPINFVLQ